jgi:hypothetical protein
MGFEDRVFREKHEDVKIMFESLRPAIKEIEKEAEKKLQEQLNLNKKGDDSPLVFPVSFSDSIILFTSDDKEDSADRIIIDAVYVLSQAIENGIPMKGAIAFGEMTVDTTNSLYFGKPIIDAYKLHQELQIYGVILHHTAQKRISELNDTKIITNAFTYDYAVPMKSGKVNHRFVDWTFFCDNPLNSVEKLYNTVSGSPRVYVDNTLEFVRWVMQKKTELDQLKKTKEKPV